jgi:sugar phosphate isomerase/epimerase
MKIQNRWALCFSLLTACLIWAWPATARAAKWEFFVFDNGVGRGTWSPEQQAETLKELGYDGISYNYTTAQDLKKWIEVFDQSGLKIYGVYVHTFPDRPQPIDPGFREAIKLLKGTGTVIWMTFRETKQKGDYDDACVRIAREMGDLAQAAGVRVAIYPHAGFYVATAADSLRIAGKAAHAQVGASYNLCHEFMTGNGDKAVATLRQVAPKSTLVSINGVDAARKNYIATLDTGDFDITGFLRELQQTGYRGPVGLQCYNIKGDIKENLRRSMDAWRKAQPGNAR